MLCCVCVRAIEFPSELACILPFRYLLPFMKDHACGSGVGTASYYPVHLLVVPNPQLKNNPEVLAALIHSLQHVLVSSTLTLFIFWGLFSPTTYKNTAGEIRHLTAKVVARGPNPKPYLHVTTGCNLCNRGMPSFSPSTSLTAPTGNSSHPLLGDPFPVEQYPS